MYFPKTETHVSEVQQHKIFCALVWFVKDACIFLDISEFDLDLWDFAKIEDNIETTTSVVIQFENREKHKLFHSYSFDLRQFIRTGYFVQDCGKTYHS